MGYNYYANYIVFHDKKFFSKWLYHCTLLPTIYEGSNFLTPLPVLVLVCLFVYSNPRGYEMALLWPEFASP
jgi:hypothetical protein